MKNSILRILFLAVFIALTSTPQEVFAQESSPALRQTETLLPAQISRTELAKLANKISRFPNFPKIVIDYEAVSFERAKFVLDFLSTVHPNEIHPSIKFIHLSNRTDQGPSHFDEVHIDAYSFESTYKEMRYFLKNRSVLQTSSTSQTGEIFQNIELLAGELKKKSGFPRVEFYIHSSTADFIRDTLKFLLTLSPLDFHPDIREIFLTDMLRITLNDQSPEKFKIIAPFRKLSPDEILQFLRNKETPLGAFIRTKTAELVEKIKQKPSIPEIYIDYENVDEESLKNVLDFLSGLSPSDLDPKIRQITISNMTTSIYFSSNQGFVRLKAFKEFSTVEEMLFLLKNAESLRDANIRKTAEPLIENLRLKPGFPTIEIDFADVDADQIVKVLQFLETLPPGEFHSEIKTLHLSHYTKIIDDDSVCLDARDKTTTIEEMRFLLKNFRDPD